MIIMHDAMLLLSIKTGWTYSEIRSLSQPDFWYYVKRLIDLNMGEIDGSK